MRKVLSIVLVAAISLIGAPLTTFAQSLGTITGQAVNASGLPVAGQQVELVLNGQIVQTTTTGARGDWSFAAVAEGDYVVRMTVNDQAAGFRVTVADGQNVANQVIVAPSAAAPSTAFLAALGLLGGLATAGAITAAVITTAVVVSGS